MAKELKLIPHDDGLLTLVDDPTWSRDHGPLVRRRLLLTLLAAIGVWALAIGALYLLGVEPYFVARFVLLPALLVSAPLAIVHASASVGIHVGHVGLTITRAFGRVRTSEVMDGVANRKPAWVGAAVAPERILWEDVEDVVWSDVHMDIRHGGGKVRRFDLEDYARDDIARLGEEIRRVWKATEGGRDEPEAADEARRDLAKLAQRQAEGPAGG